MGITSKTLISDQDIEWEIIDETCKRKIMAYDDNLMLVKVAFEKGGVGALHHHPHLQMSYVAEGAFEVSIGDDKKVLSSGDVFFVPSEEVHGVICLEKGLLVDVFNPVRKDFLK
ncbi:MAG: quercetin dioxygenase-like cupin family protein [Spirosomataceae bacterium]